MRVLITGGGTAGHINPAIALADIIKQHNKQDEVAFVGTPDGMEKKLVEAAGYHMYPIRVKGFRRSLSPQNIQAAWLALTSPHAAAQIISSFRPSLVIGTGGYVCWPLLRAATKMGIPAALHESNAIPGLATRKLAPYMDAIWLNFRETAAALPPRCVSPIHTGNPLRRDFSTVSREAARRELHLSDKDFFILSFGGSRGAEEMNKALIRFMNEELPRDPHLYHAHACGEAHFEACRAMLSSPSSQAVLLPYISKMATYMSAADIVICRAGAMTLSELAICRKCAILVPSPYVAGDHQRKNAAIFANEGAACVVEESDLPTNKLRNIIFKLKEEDFLRKNMQKSIEKLAKKQANAILYQQIRFLAEKRAAD